MFPAKDFVYDPQKYATMVVFYDSPGFTGTAWPRRVGKYSPTEDMEIPVNSIASMRVGEFAVAIVGDDSTPVVAVGVQGPRDVPDLGALTKRVHIVEIETSRRTPEDELYLDYLYPTRLRRTVKQVIRIPPDDTTVAITPTIAPTAPITPTTPTASTTTTTTTTPTTPITTTPTPQSPATVDTQPVAPAGVISDPTPIPSETENNTPAATSQTWDSPFTQMLILFVILLIAGLVIGYKIQHDVESVLTAAQKR